MFPPLILLGLGIGALLYFSSRSSASPGPSAAELTEAVQGKSGKLWRVTPISKVGDFVTVAVWALKDQFGPHSAFPVLQYRQTGTDMKSRLFVMRYPNVPDISFQTAVSDFGLTVRGG